jgi:hypothetical protein
VKNTTKALALIAALAGALSLTDASPLSATPASADKGPGCYVTDANGVLYFAASCQAHDVIRYNADGSLAFYSYQDAGNLPAGAALPETTIHNSYEQCLNFSSGVACGTVDEFIMPSGAYKSSFRTY